MSKQVFDKIRIKNTFGDNYIPEEYMELAEVTKNGRITIFAKSWKNFCVDLEHYFTVAYQNITHETLHVVIDNIIEEDILDYKEEHWPHLNGMDEPYVNNWE